VAQFTNAVIGSFTVVVGAALAARIAGRRAGLVAAALLAVYPPLLANDLVPLSEPLSFLLILGLVWFLADQRWVLASVTAGLLALCYHSAQLLIVLIVPWIVCKAGWRVAVKFSVATALVIVPWIVRNELQLHTPVLTTSNGFNLAAVYSSQTVESPLLFLDPVSDSAFAPLWEARVDEVRWESVLRQQGLVGLSSHPGRVVKVFTTNIKQMAELHPRANAAADKIDGRNMRVRNDTMIVFYLVTIFGVVGLWRYRRLPQIWLLSGMAVYFTVMAAFFVPPARLRGPLDLACCLGVALLLARNPPALRPVVTESAPGRELQQTG
jgi:hypothetical protein